MFNLIIRAVTNKGKAFDLEQIRIDAALTFTMIHKCASAMEAFPDVSWIPNVWKNELYPEFIKREGTIVAFLMIKLKGSEEETLNCMYFKVDDEGRRTLKIIHKNIIQSSGVLTTPIPDIQGHLQKHEMIHEKFKEIDLSGNFHQHEMSKDFHMGYYEEAKDLVVRKDREPGDNSGVFHFPSTIPANIVDLSNKVTDFISINKPGHSIDLAPKSKDDSDWYSEQQNHGQTLYRIYINGKMSNMVVDDISFMKTIHENSANELFGVHDIPGNMEMPQYLFNTIIEFLHHRDFKLGAHPEVEPLEDGNDAIYSILWGHEEKEVIYVSPLTSTYDFD